MTKCARENLRAARPTTLLVLDRSEFARILAAFPKDREAIMHTAKAACNSKKSAPQRRS